MKLCKRCDIEKELTEFSKHKRNYDGLQTYCKVCMNAARAEWNAKYPEKRHAANKSWAEKNPNKVREKSLAWRNRNIEFARKRTQDWKKNNPEKNARNEQRRRASKSEVKQGHFPTLTELILMYGDKCMYPNCLNIKLTIDHVVPLAMGGDHDITNTQILCRFHNSQKGGRKSTDYRLKESNGTIS